MGLIFETAQLGDLTKDASAWTFSERRFYRFVENNDTPQENLITLPNGEAINDIISASVLLPNSGWWSNDFEGFRVTNSHLRKLAGDSGDGIEITIGWECKVADVSPLGFPLEPWKRGVEGFNVRPIEFQDTLKTLHYFKKEFKKNDEQEQEEKENFEKAESDVKNAIDKLATAMSDKINSLILWQRVNAAENSTQYNQFLAAAQQSDNDAQASWDESVEASITAKKSEEKVILYDKDFRTTANTEIIAEFPRTALSITFSKNVESLSVDFALQYIGKVNKDAVFFRGLIFPRLSLLVKVIGAAEQIEYNSNGTEKYRYVKLDFELHMDSETFNQKYLNASQYFLTDKGISQIWTGNDGNYRYFGEKYSVLEKLQSDMAKETLEAVSEPMFLDIDGNIANWDKNTLTLKKNKDLPEGMQKPTFVEGCPYAAVLMRDFFMNIFADG
ncbi:MAG: hypothetical protein LBT46_15500 [Planctomycetaceae bacterium]|jgi:hypothetical protein|nr:hypothetical protein [Planctomycetaceae bacterium]